MKYFILAFALFFGMSSFAAQEEEEYSIEYDSNGKMFIYRKTFKIFASGKKHAISAHVDPEDLPEDYELILETKLEMAGRIINDNKWPLLGLIVGLPTTIHVERLAEKKIDEQTKDLQEKLDNASSEEEKNNLSYRLAYERNNRPFYTFWKEAANKLTLTISIGSIKGIAKMMAAIKEGRRYKLIKKELPKSE